MRTADGVEGGQVSNLCAEGADRGGTAQEPVGRMVRGGGVGAYKGRFFENQVM